MGQIKAIDGSWRPLHARPEELKPLNEDEKISVTVVLADPVDESRKVVEQYGSKFGLMSEDKPGGSSVCLTGIAKNIQKAFLVRLQTHIQTGHRVRETGEIYVDDSVKPHVLAVLGLDQRPIVKPYALFRQSPDVEDKSVPKFRAHCDPKSVTEFTPPQVARLYGFPEKLTGAGQTVAIIELGGGFQCVDVDAYLAGLGIDKRAKLQEKLINGAKNQVNVDEGADGEVQLDIDIVASIVPDAQINVFFAPNTEQGFYDAIASATHDPATTVISISWGAPETMWTGSAITAVAKIIEDAAKIGITVCVASGDSGSSDGTSTPTVDFPASAASALACGGTRLDASLTEIHKESAWNSGGDRGATGGGFSLVFQKPKYQPSDKAYRGVPDVSGNADPGTGYVVRVNGGSYVIGGTSAVSPLWAALLAQCAQALGKRQHANPLLYAAKDSCRDVVVGDNGAYKAAHGWDPTTGLGAPIGQQVLVALGGKAK